MKRREYLGLTTALVVAGCTGSSDDSPDPDNESDPDDTSPATGGERTNEAIELPGSLDNFDDLARWDLVEGSLDVETERSLVGSQSAKLSVGPLEDAARIVRTFDEPIDCSGMAPGLALAGDDRVGLAVQLYDSSRSKFTYRASVEGGIPLERQTFGLHSISGDPDPTDIVEMDLVFWAGEGRDSAWIDDFHFVERSGTGTVLLQFDGGYESAYSVGRPVLEEYDFQATSFVSPDRLRQEGTSGSQLTAEQVASLADDGWTIASGGVSGESLRGLDSDEQEREIQEAKSWLEEHGYEDGARFFSYPHGQYDETTVEHAREHHDITFASGYGAHGTVTNPALCPRVIDPTLLEARRVLDWTAEYGGITTLSFFRLGPSSKASFENAMKHLDDLVSAGDLEVALPADLDDHVES